MIDTVGLVPQVELEDGVPHSDKVHIVERARLAQPDLLEIRTVVTDPEVLAKPWDYVTRYARRRGWSITEYVCEQNNHDDVDSTGRLGQRLQP